MSIKGVTKTPNSSNNKSVVLNFNRVDSSKIAFLLSIPALTGASVLGLKDVLQQSIQILSDLKPI